MPYHIHYPPFTIMKGLSSHGFPWLINTPELVNQGYGIPFVLSFLQIDHRPIRLYVPHGGVRMLPTTRTRHEGPHYFIDERGKSGRIDEWPKT